MIFIPNDEKITAALSYLDSRIYEAKPGSTIPYKAYHNIFFFAEVLHLNKHNRPILFDNWQAYIDGPSGNGLSDRINCYEEYDWDRLSKSDKETIEYAFDTYLSFLGPYTNLNKIVQQHPAFTKALARGIGSVIEIKDMLHSGKPQAFADELLYNLAIVNTQYAKSLQP